MATPKFISLFALLAVWILFGACPPAQAAPKRARLSEYQVKVGYLYNFARFVDWPAQAFGDERAAIRLGILGKDPFGEDLKFIRDKTAHGRRFEIRQVAGAGELKECHILFIGSSEKKNLEHILAGLRGSPVLTVSDMEGFAQRGGTINFIRTEGRIRFAVNPGAARRAGLTISSKLLRLADIVNDVIEENEK